MGFKVDFLSVFRKLPGDAFPEEPKHVARIKYHKRMSYTKTKTCCA